MERLILRSTMGRWPSGFRPTGSRASVTNGTGPGQAGRLIEVGTYTTNASGGWWSIYLDAGGTNIYFSAQTNGGSFTNYIAFPFVWTNDAYGDWHFVALTYSSSNSALYVDGVLATNGPGVRYFPGPDTLTNGFSLLSASNGTFQARGSMDDLFTYNYPLSSAEVADSYALYSLFRRPLISSIGSAPSTPVTSPVFLAVTGRGWLTFQSNAPNCTTSSSIWITNVTATRAANGTETVVFTIAGGSNNTPYDVFATAALESPITNGVWG